MELIFKNNIEIKQPCDEIIDYCENKLTIDNPDYIIAERLGKNTRYMQKKMKLYYVNGDTFVLPFGTIKDVYKIAKNYNCEMKLNFSENKAIFLQGGVNLYDYQQIALNRLKSGKNGVLIAPCGAGKTNIGLALIKELGLKALWITHTHKLLTQSLNRAKSLFPNGDYGTITEGEVNIGKDITFATVQTMSKIDCEIYKNEFNVVIVDETQHCIGSPTKVMQFYKVLSNLNARYKYGLSATIKDDAMSKTVYSILGEKLHTIDKEAVGDKIIKAKHLKIEIPLFYDIESYSNYDGTLDYNKLINMLSSDNDRNIIICNKIREEHKKQLILCHRVQQVKDLCEMLSDLDAVGIYGGIKDKNRDFDHKIIIATYSLAKEGLDIPDLDVLHLATPQKDYITTVQSVGRVERNIKGKEQPIVYDYVDNDIRYCVNCFKKRKSYLTKKK